MKITMYAIGIALFIGIISYLLYQGMKDYEKGALLPVQKTDSVK